MCSERVRDTKQEGKINAIIIGFVLFCFALQWWQVDKVSPVKLFEENKTIAGFNLRHLLYQQNNADYVHGILNKVFDLWKESKIAPVIDSKWALEDVSILNRNVRVDLRGFFDRKGPFMIDDRLSR